MGRSEEQALLGLLFFYLLQYCYCVCSYYDQYPTRSD